MGLGLIGNNGMTDSITIECGATNHSKLKEQIKIQNQMNQHNPIKNSSAQFQRAEYYSQDKLSIPKHIDCSESLIVRRANSAQMNNEYQSRKRLRNYDCKINRAEKYNRAEMDNRFNNDLKKEELIFQYQQNKKNSFERIELKIEVVN